MLWSGELGSSILFFLWAGGWPGPELEALVVSSTLSKVTCLHCAVRFCCPRAVPAQRLTPGGTSRWECLYSKSGRRRHGPLGLGGGLNSSLDARGSMCQATHRRQEAAGVATHLLQARSGVCEAVSWGDAHHAECYLSGGKQSGKSPDSWVSKAWMWWGSSQARLTRARYSLNKTQDAGCAGWDTVPKYCGYVRDLSLQELLLYLPPHLFFPCLHPLLPSDNQTIWPNALCWDHHVTWRRAMLLSQSHFPYSVWLNCDKRLKL